MANLPPVICDGLSVRKMSPDDVIVPTNIGVARLVVAGSGVSVVDNGDGTVTIRNLCCGAAQPNDSVHTVVSVTPAKAAITEGESACWNVTLNAPVAGSQLSIPVHAAYSGAGVYANGYVIVPVGASSAQFCQVTVDDQIYQGDRNMCLTLEPTARVTSVPPASCVLVHDNDSPPVDTTPSTHVVTSLVPVSADIVEGDVASWRVTLDVPVANAPLVLSSALSGDEQGIHNYPAPSLTIPVGQKSGVFNVSTTDDTDVEPARQLRLTIAANPRITSGSSTSVVNVLDNDGMTSTHVVSSLVPVSVSITEGQTASWLVTLDSPVTGAPLVIMAALSGSEQTVHNYPAPSLTIPVGQQSGLFHVATTDDTDVEETLQLRLNIEPNVRITGGATAANVSVLDNDASSGGSGLVGPPTFGQDFPCAFRSSNHDAAATAVLTFYPDGTWRATRTFGAANDGNWYHGVPTNPADYEMRVTGQKQKIVTTSGTFECMEPPIKETNTAVDTGWLRLDTEQYTDAWAYATANAHCTSQDAVTEFPFTIEIRQVSNPSNAVIGTGILCAEASAYTN